MKIFATLMLISTLYFFGYWLAVIFSKPKKLRVASRHKWYTLSGMVSRLSAFFSQRWAEQPTELFPVAVFVYGMSELFGLTRSIKVILRLNKNLRRRHNARTKKEANVRSVRNGA